MDLDLYGIIQELIKDRFIIIQDQETWDHISIQEIVGNIWLFNILLVYLYYYETTLDT
jgi:hypothetical protein